MTKVGINDPGGGGVIGTFSIWQDHKSASISRSSVIDIPICNLMTRIRFITNKILKNHVAEAWLFLVPQILSLL